MLRETYQKSKEDRGRIFAGWSDMLQRPQNTQEIQSNREHYKEFSKTEIFTRKSWILYNKRTLYELKRLQNRVSTVFRDLQKELTGCRYIQMDEL